MTRVLVAVALTIGLAPGAVVAQTPPSLEPPRAIGATDVEFPADAPAISAPVVVTVKLLVDAAGAVTGVELVTPPQPVFDDAVVAAARSFAFEPGRYGGKPVPVTVTFTHTFVPLPPAPVPDGDGGPPRTSALRGTLVELGTRAAVASATVTAEIAGQTYTAEAGADGAFRLELPPGAAVVSVYAPGHARFTQRETLAAHQELAVKYLVERDRYDPYEIVVVGNEPKREEVSRISLRGKEVQEVPGTFGDPFRVVQTLPGVGSVASVLPYPIVRGSSPSSTGFSIDGTEIPILYHLLAGPSVIHPDFIDSIEFFPGGAPVSYGGYTGGIIDGRTVRAGKDDHLIDLDANLFQVGGLIREPVPALDATVTAAARYGFPGFLLSLATDQVSLSYWDYQLRLDGGTKANGWTVFAFGARDALDTVAPGADKDAGSGGLASSFVTEFHRLDLRAHQTLGRLETTYRLVGGYDHTLSVGTDVGVLLANPSIRARYRHDDHLALDAGIDASVHDVRQGASQVQDVDTRGLASITADLSTQYRTGGYAEALYRPTPDWLIRPGVRGDVFADRTATRSSVDPRISARYKLGHRDLPGVRAESDDSAIWLKAAAGIYHQAPSFALPTPGLDELSLKYALSRAYQTSLGAELPLAARLQLSAEGFYNYLDPTSFDLSTNKTTAGTTSNTQLLPTEIVNPETTPQSFIDRLSTPERGRSYGVELMLRRQSTTGVFGWISYTLSRSDRDQDQRWRPYDYDRTHLLNLVAGLPLAHNWDLGVRAAYQSGVPETTTAGYNTGRGDGYLQFDLRVDKRAVFHSWLLDIYVDITNVALLPEEITAGNTIRYVLPTIGLRGKI
jgi:TonB family protein